VTGALLIGLWQAGAIFDHDKGGPQDNSDSLPATEHPIGPARTDIETPTATGLSVGLKEGQLAPDFEFSAFDGSRQRLSDYRGRAVFLNFWATWCGPCRYELPDMETLLGENGDRLAVIAVNNGEDFGRARSYIDGLGVKLTAFAYDPKQDVVKLYGLYGMPTSFFIDQRGVITRVYPGQISLAIMRTAASEAIGASGAVGR
jgi:thiol-disulfide isomerase/thioredoxin